jgi:hypothetical protein
VPAKARVFNFSLRLWREPAVSDEGNDDGWRGSVRPVTPRPDDAGPAAEPFVGLSAVSAAVVAALERVLGKKP